MALKAYAELYRRNIVLLAYICCGDCDILLSVKYIICAQAVLNCIVLLIVLSNKSISYIMLRNTVVNSDIPIFDFRSAKIFLSDVIFWICIHYSDLSKFSSGLTRLISVMQVF